MKLEHFGRGQEVSAGPACVAGHDGGDSDAWLLTEQLLITLGAHDNTRLTSDNF